MKELIEKQKAPQAEATALKHLIQAKFKELDFKGKLAVYRELGSDWMGEETYYTGNIPGSRVSLYDDFYWERHETKSLDEIEDFVSDHFQDEDEEGDFDEYLETSDHDRARVFRDMLENCIGEATYDW